MAICRTRDISREDAGTEPVAEKTQHSDGGDVAVIRVGWDAAVGDGRRRPTIQSCDKETVAASTLPSRLIKIKCHALIQVTLLSKSGISVCKSNVFLRSSASR